MITLDNLKFSYTNNGIPALTGVTAKVGPGFHLLVGENGAGKTTLLHLLAGVASPTSGECRIDNYPADSKVPSKMGRTFLLEENMYFPGKTILDFANRHAHFYPKFSEEKFLNNLAAFGLSGYEKFKYQSLGNRKKAQLAYVLALGVEVLLLDEPTNALDIQSKEILRKMLASSQTDNQTVIVATHTISELENLFDGAMILNRSQLLYSGTAEDVSKHLSFEVLRMPDSSAIYQEVQVGRVLAIFPSDGENNETKVDWRLLYSAFHSDKKEELKRILSR